MIYIIYTWYTYFGATLPHTNPSKWTARCHAWIFRHPPSHSALDLRTWPRTRGACTSALPQCIHPIGPSHRSFPKKEYIYISYLYITYISYIIYNIWVQCLATHNCKAPWTYIANSFSLSFSHTGRGTRERYRWNTNRSGEGSMPSNCDARAGGCARATRATMLGESVGANHGPNPLQL